MTDRTQAIEVSTMVMHMLLRFMDAESLPAPDIRQRIHTAMAQPRVGIEVWWGLLEDIAECKPVPALGARIGRHLKIQDTGILGYLAASCATLGEAVARLQRYEAMIHNLAYTRIKTEQDGFSLVWDGHGNDSTVLSNAVVVSATLALLNELAGNNAVQALLVKLINIPKAEKQEYEDWLGCPVEITGNIQAIKLPLSILSLPIDGQNPQLRAILDQQADAIMATLPHPDTFTRTIQQAIMKGLDNGQASFSWLCQELDTSERSLYRKLEERGHSYQELLDRLRQQLAVQYLQDRQLSLTNIGLMLGYSEHSAFTRAFKSWTGTTPLRFRKMLQSGQQPPQTMPIHEAPGKPQGLAGSKRFRFAMKQKR